MTVHRLRRYALYLLAVFLIPPLLWVGVVLVAPTAWAKNQVVAAMQARTGRSVRLDRLAVGFLGGIRLTNVEIGSPQSLDDPWLKAADVRLELSIVELLRGGMALRSIKVDGVDLRVLRRTDGTLEIADLVRRETEPQSHSDSHSGKSSLVIHIQGGSATLIDLMSQTRLHMQNVEGEATRTEAKTVINHLRGVLNGGPFQVVGEVDRTTSVPSIECRFQAQDVVLDDGMNALRYAVPVLAGAPLNLKGHLTSELYIQGNGSTWDAFSRSLVGHGQIAIDPVDLDGAPLVAELSKLAELSRQGHVASIQSDFVIKDRRITTDHFTLTIGRVPMALSGWTDFDGHVDYRINLASLNSRLPKEARRLLGELNVELETLASLSLRGTVNRMAVQLNGIPLDKKLLRNSDFKREDREKLRVLGRQFLDQLVR
jgi:AsmA-like C-terminal region